MGIILILVILLGLCAVGIKIAVTKNSWLYEDLILTLHLISVALDTALLICVVCAIAYSVVTDREIRDVTYERKAIVYTLEHSETNVIAKAEAVANFNIKVNDAKYYRDNFWIGWFIDRAYADTEEIELSDQSEEK